MEQCERAQVERGTHEFGCDLAAHPAVSLASSTCSRARSGAEIAAWSSSVRNARQLRGEHDGKPEEGRARSGPSPSLQRRARLRFRDEKAVDQRTGRRLALAWLGRRRSRHRSGLRAFVANGMRESVSRVDRSECSGRRHKPHVVDSHSSAPGTARDKIAGVDGHPDVRQNVFVADVAPGIHANGPLGCLKSTPADSARLEHLQLLRAEAVTIRCSSRPEPSARRWGRLPVRGLPPAGSVPPL